MNKELDALLPHTVSPGTGNRVKGGGKQVRSRSAFPYHRNLKQRRGEPGAAEGIQSDEKRNGGLFNLPLMLPNTWQPGAGGGGQGRLPRDEDAGMGT